MSPDTWSDIFGNPDASVLYVGVTTDKGKLMGSRYGVNSNGGVRPVISLKSCVTVASGDGTASSPYTVSVDAACSSAEN